MHLTFVKPGECKGLCVLYIDVIGMPQRPHVNNFVFLYAMNSVLMFLLPS